MALNAREPYRLRESADPWIRGPHCTENPWACGSADPWIRRRGSVDPRIRGTVDSVPLWGNRTGLGGEACTVPRTLPYTSIDPQQHLHAPQYTHLQSPPSPILEIKMHLRELITSSAGSTRRTIIINSNNTHDYLHHDTSSRNTIHHHHLSSSSQWPPSSYYLLPIPSSSSS